MTNILPQGWQEVRLGDVCDVVGGGTPSTKEEQYWNGDIPWLSPRDLSGYNYKYISKGSKNITEYGMKKSSTKIIPKNSVLVSSRAPIGYVAIAKNDICTNQGFKSLVLNSGQNSNYFYYWVKANSDLLQSLGTGSTFKEISGNVIKNIETQIPPLPEQKRIADILSALDDKIENNRRMNETLENMAQAMFKSWFVDFEPVHCLIALKNGTSKYKTKSQIAKSLYMTEQTLNLFPDSFGDNGLPMGWEEREVGDILNRLKTPNRYKKEDVLEYGNVPVYEQGEKILLGYHNNEPDFIVSNKDMAFIFGDHTCITKLSNIPFSISSNVIPLKGSIYSASWVYYAIVGKQEFQEYKRHWSDLIMKKVITPSVELAQCFSDIIEIYESKKTLIQQETQTLTKTRDTLLPKLISGKVRV